MWFSNSTSGYMQKTPIFIKVSAVERRKWSTLMAADFQFCQMSKF